jgi:galactosyl transferase GMA12/MNN10 family
MFATFFFFLICYSVTPGCDYSKIIINEECPSLNLNWEFYGEELYKARGLQFTMNPSLALQQTHQLLKMITSQFHIGFECPLASGSTIQTLAQQLSIEKRFRRAQALIFLAYIYVRDKGFHDCTPWPIQGWDMMLAGKHLSDVVRAMDDASKMTRILGRELIEQGRIVLPDSSKNYLLSILPNGATFDLQNKDKSIQLFEPHSIGIVSVCAYSNTEHVKLVAEENHRLYAEMHGYQLFQFDEDLGNSVPVLGMDIKDRKKFFWKVVAVGKVMLEHPEIKWVMWMDCDALFMDPKRSIDSVIGMYGFGVNSTPETDLLIAVDSTGLNNGVWMMRNSEWSHSFLVTWWNSPILQGNGTYHNCSDQSTMLHELLYANTVGIEDILDPKLIEKELYGNLSMWGDNVRVVPQEYIQSFHEATAQSVLSRAWVEGDFVKHFPGCHYYRKECQYMYYEAHDLFMQKLQEIVLFKK